MEQSKIRQLSGTRTQKEQMKRLERNQERKTAGK